MNRLICHHANGTPNCIAYEHYFSKDDPVKGEDLIEKSEDGKYKCVALESLLQNLKKGKVPKIDSRLFYRYNEGGLGCSHLELLNNSRGN